MSLFLIGGTGFIGRHVMRRLVAAGHAVTVFHRGETTPDLPPAVDTVRGNRDDADALPSALDGAAPDVVVDVIPYTKAQVAALMDMCPGRTGRVVVLSSGDVYRQYDGLRPERSEEVVSGLRGSSDHPPDPLPLTEDAPLRTSRYPYRGTETDFAHAQYYDKILVEETVRAGAVPALFCACRRSTGRATGIVTAARPSRSCAGRTGRWCWGKSRRAGAGRVGTLRTWPEPSQRPLRMRRRPGARTTSASRGRCRTPRGSGAWGPPQPLT